MPGSSTGHGLVAAGHPATAEAAVAVLEDGGNAYDATVAAILAACVAEPTLVSLGGGFLLARPESGPPRLYDFFTQTPRSKRKGSLDFRVIHGDFGGTKQAFHIGLGSVATPGMVKGLFRVQRDLGRLPMAALAQPAIRLAREGVTVNAVQAYARRVLDPIVTATAGARDQLAGDPADGRALDEGARFRLPEHAEVLEALVREGDRLFYRGSIAQQIIDTCRDGGHLTASDLAAYRVAIRRPLVHTYRGHRLLLNPAPSLGGSLIGFSLALLDALPPASTEGERLVRLARALAATDSVRTTDRVDTRASMGARTLIGKRVIDRYQRAWQEGTLATRGTTHVSVIDRWGNVASTTVSNGEGCGHVLPGTGVMLNNMLGEEDLAPDGFQHWPENRRLVSMMAPTVVEGPGGRLIALGTGGSNRIRSAIVQVLCGLLDDELSPERAVNRARGHLDHGTLEIEPGYSDHAIRQAAREPSVMSVNPWPARNMFFGGVHVAERDPRTGICQGAGDPRRGGVARSVVEPTRRHRA